MMALAVPPAMVAQLPQQVWHYVDSAVELPSEVQFDVFTGKSVLWIAVDDQQNVFGAAVTQIEEETATRERLLVIIAYGSDDHDKAGRLMSTLDDYGRAEGCSRVRIYGRPGWKRRLPGFEVKAVIMDKVL
jgi:hypothetical protein